MGKVTLRGGALLSPVPPAIVTCAADGKVNAVTVAWTGILSTKPPMTYISLRPERYSYAIIRESGEFVINLTTASLARAADYIGMYTGRKRDKLSDMGLTVVPSETVACPAIEQSPLSLECRVERIIPLGSHHVFVARILAARADAELISPSGRLELERAGLCAYAHGEYFALGESLGKFGFSVKKKKRRKVRR